MISGYHLVLKVRLVVQLPIPLETIDADFGTKNSPP
jgi:hypothetical protein